MPTIAAVHLHSLFHPYFTRYVFFVVVEETFLFIAKTSGEVSALEILTQSMLYWSTSLIQPGYGPIERRSARLESCWTNQKLRAGFARLLGLTNSSDVAQTVSMTS